MADIDRVAVSIQAERDQSGAMVLIKTKLATGQVEVTVIPSTIAIALYDELMQSKGPLKSRPHALRRARDEMPSIIQNDWNSPPVAASVGVSVSREQAALQFPLSNGVMRDYFAAHEVIGLLLDRIHNLRPSLLDLRTPRPEQKN